MNHTGEKTLGELLSESFQILTARFYPLFLLTITVYAPLAVLHVLLFVNVDPHLILSEGDPIAIRQYYSTQFIYFIISVGAMMLYQVALFLMVRDIDRQQLSARPYDYFSRAVPLLGAYLVVGLLVLMKVALWSLLLIMPGIAFAVFYSFAHLALIVDDIRGNRALVFSKALIKPYFWKFVGYTLTVTLLTFIAGTVIQILVGMVTGFGLAAQPTLLNRTLEAMLGVVNGIIGLYPSLFLYLLYHELKVKTQIVPSQA